MVVRGGASASPAGRESEIAYVDVESVARRLALIDAWSVPFEECMPVRGFPSYKGRFSAVHIEVETAQNALTTARPFRDDYFWKILNGQTVGKYLDSFVV